MTARLVENMPSEQYHADEAVSSSTLKAMLRSPAHCRQGMLVPMVPTPAMETGTAIHCAMLEPDKFDKSYVVPPKCDRRTKIGKATWAEFLAANPDAEIVTRAQWDSVQGMANALWNHPITSDLLSGDGKNEASIFWTDEETGLPCRVRPDRITYHRGVPCLVDLKKTQDARRWRFQRQAAALGMHLSAAMYLDGANQLAEIERRFLHIAIEEQPPHGIMVYELTEQDLDIGNMAYRDTLRKFAFCKESDSWPCYPTAIAPLELPGYAAMDLAEGNDDE